MSPMLLMLRRVGTVYTAQAKTYPVYTSLVALMEIGTRLKV
jgi:hypothetical protein